VDCEEEKNRRPITLRGEEMKKFWMVLGSGTPVFRHDTKGSAIVEAERLAKSHPDTEFVVLESLATVIRNNVTWKSHEPPNEAYEDGFPF
jgi:hypothetical protein